MVSFAYSVENFVAVLTFYEIYPQLLDLGDTKCLDIGDESSSCCTCQGDSLNGSFNTW